MDRPDVFMPLYIGDYLAGTSRLSTELHGAYLLLIMDYWMNGPLPDNDSTLAAITKMSVDAWSNARAMLEQYFSIANGEWKHKRIEQELEVATNKKAAAKAKAEAAAAARWAKKNNKKPENAPSNAPSIPQALHEECPSPSPSPVLEPKGSNNLGDEPPEKPKQTRFAPPTVEQVREYCQERGNSIDPQKFVDHYAGSGWMRGKTKIKDWKACVRTWENNETEQARASPGQPYKTAMQQRSERAEATFDPRRATVF